MARLLEHQAKRILAAEKIPVPRGGTASTPTGAHAAADQIGGTVVVKAQIRQGRRAKAGGIRFAESPSEAADVAAEMLGRVIHGAPVRELLIEEKLDIATELYLGIIVSGAADRRSPVCILSGSGGTEIEEVPDSEVYTLGVDVLGGLRAYQGIDLARRTDLPSSMRARVGSVAASLYRVFVKYDCRTIEINPLVVTSQGAVVAADCRMAIDDNALFRHPDLDITLTHETDREPTLFDEIAWSIDQMDPRGTGYVAQMQQSIDAVATVGYHGIGGGGAILGVDALNRAGLRVANYADTSGNPTAAKVYRVARLILSQPGIDGYCLGGFVVANQEQWHHAHGIVKALREELAARPGFPVLLLLCGNGEEEALRILREGLSDLPGRIEIHGRRQVWDTDFIAGRMRALIDEYQAKRRAPEGGVL